MQFILQNHMTLITTLDELHQQLEQVYQREWSEVWLKVGDEGSALTMLVDGKHVILIYLHDPGDAGFCSRNPHYTGPTSATMDFAFSNGDVSVLPLAWVIPLEEAYAACDYFLLSQGDRSPAILWHDDSS